jgi:sulfate adenylyltransferase subunit 1 (EFTu-like GTPase family)
MSDAHHDYRGYAGQVAGGVLRAGDDVVVLPSGLRSRVSSIDTYDGPVEEAFVGMSVTVRLADDVDVSRGDMIVRAGDEPSTSQDVEAVVCWMVDQPLRQGGRYAIKHTTRWARAMVAELEYRLDVNTLGRDDSATELALNEIGRVRLRVTAPLMHDPYTQNRTTGSFILVDEATNVTAGAGMIAS